MTPVHGSITHPILWELGAYIPTIAKAILTAAPATWLVASLLGWVL